MPDETTRAAALKRGEVDVAFLLSGPTGEDIKRTPGFRSSRRCSASSGSTSPTSGIRNRRGRDKRVRQAASARHRPSGAQPGGDARPLTRRSATSCRATSSSRCRSSRRRTIPRARRSCSPRPGYPNGFDGGEFTPFPPYNSMGETLERLAASRWASARGCASMERGAFMAAWREKKHKGVVLTITGISGNAATRLEPFVDDARAPSRTARCPRWTTSSIARRRSWTRRSARRCCTRSSASIHDQVIFDPGLSPGLPDRHGPARWRTSWSASIPGFYMAPYEDLKFKAR